MEREKYLKTSRRKERVRVVQEAEEEKEQKMVYIQGSPKETQDSFLSCALHITSSPHAAPCFELFLCMSAKVKNRNL